MIQDLSFLLFGLELYKSDSCKVIRILWTFGLEMMYSMLYMFNFCVEIAIGLRKNNTCMLDHPSWRNTHLRIIIFFSAHLLISPLALWGNPYCRPGWSWRSPSSHQEQRCWWRCVLAPFYNPFLIFLGYFWLLLCNLVEWVAPHQWWSLFFFKISWKISRSAS